MGKFLITVIFMLLSIDVQSQQINEILDHEDLRYAQLSLSVRNVESGELLQQHNGDILLIPASSLKLITTFSTLSAFGEGFRYRTTLGYQGKICLLYTSPSPRDKRQSRMPSSA